METPTPPPPVTTTVKTETPHPDSDSPSLTNGVLNRHKSLHHHHHHPPPPVLVSYKECLKNHAAAIGGHAVDGCGEFMPSPHTAHFWPTSLKCAVCGCHRNFHRRDNNNPPIEYHRHHPPPPPTAGSRGNSPSPPPISSSYYPSAPHTTLALTTVFPSPPADNNHIPAIPTTPGSGGGSGSNPKRFRTKFTQDQKQKMQEVAERVEWKMQKRHEDIIIAFCDRIGVGKNVFKVWMRNNKTNKKDPTNNNINVTNSSSSDGKCASSDGKCDFH